MSSHTEQQIADLLTQHKAVLVRQSKHFVYRLPNNKNFVMAKGAGDPRAALNNLSDLRRQLGIKPERNEPRERERHKKKRFKASSLPTIYNETPAAPVSTFASQLKDVYYGPDLHMIQPNEFHAELNYALRMSRSTEAPPEPEHDPRPSPPRQRRPRQPHEPPPRVRILPPEIRQKANQILQKDGEAAMRDFLNQHRDQFTEVDPNTARRIAREHYFEEIMEATPALTKPTTSPSKIETVRLTKQHLETLLHDCDRIILDKQQLKIKTEAELNEINQWIVAYEMLEQQDEKIKPILPAAPQAPSVGMSLVNANGKRNMMSPILHVFRNNPKTQFDAESVLRAIKEQLPAFDGRAIDVIRCLGYLHTNGKLQRASRGVYVLRSDNGTAKAATA